MSERAAHPAETARDLTIPERFARRVSERPDAIAVRGEASAMTYGELDALSKRLASALSASAAPAGARVGLLLDDGPHAIAAMLGVLEADRVYVPLDPTYPAARTAYMAGDADVAAILTDRRNEATARRLVGPSASVFVVEDVDRHPAPLTGVARDPDAPAYILYTSGSTGEPKGVVQTHRNLLHFVDAYASTLAIAPEDRLSLVYSFSFSASLMDIYGALLRGATVCHYDLRRRGLGDLPRWLREEGVTVLHAVPTVFRHLIDSLEAEDSFPAIRAVDLGGEPVFRRDVAAFRRRFAREAVLVNHLAFTEASVTAQLSIRHDTEVSEDRVGVGYAAPGVRVEIVGDDGAPAPDGVVGELVVRSRHVSPGYWRKPELTAASFLDATGGAERAYRTGDLGRVAPDGRIEHVGRRDARLKIRGFSIEVAEIEHALHRAPGVREAVVVAVEESAGNPRLVAYLVGEGGARAPSSALRATLAAALPEHMIPSTFVWLASMPLTESGKVDRRALATARETALEGRGDVAPPETATERALAEIWSRLLGVSPVGIDDDFFSLGGHSLYVMQLVSRMRRDLGVEIALRSVFEARTLRAIAALVDAERWAPRARAPADGPRPRPRGAPRAGELPLSFAQQGMWFLDRLDPDSVAYTMSVAVLLTGLLDVPALGRSLEEIVRRHEALRTTLPALDGEPWQVIGAASSFSLSVVDLESVSPTLAPREAEARRRAANEARRPFDLARGPLFRATLLRSSAQAHLLSMTMHHVVSDGWSIGVLLRELAALHEAFSAGQPSPLPELPVQYADHALWQRGWLSGGVLDAQLAYWKEQLRGAPGALELPTDRPRPAVQSYRGAAHSFRFPRALSAALAALCRREGVTLFMTLLAALQVLLHRYSGEDDIVVGSPVAGRTRLETEGLIGLFVNTLVLRTNLGGEPTFRELLAQVREQTLGAHAHQDVPFEKLVEALAPARDLGRSPLFQVMLVLQGTPAHPPALGEAALSVIEVGTATAKFDLSVSITETARGLEGSLSYATDLFEAATIERMAGHLRVLLEGVVDDPARPVAELPILTDAERRQLVVTWNDTRVDVKEETRVHALFEAQAARTPDATALVFEERQLTYRALNARANRLAHHLRSLGVGPDVLVGICVERSLAMMAGLLGVLKAGGAYVPLDPEYPRDRLAFMLEDSRATVVLTQARLEGALPAGGARRVLVDDESLFAGEAADNPDVTTRGGDLAYVIYTSGSTGVPKGVMVTHHGVDNYLTWRLRTLGLTANDRVLQKTSISFDSSVWELFEPLAVGATLVLAPPAAHRDPRLLLRLIEAHGITATDFVPSLLQVLLEDPEAARSCRSLRRITTGGEALSRDLVRRFSRCSKAALYNGYGPTETTVASTFWACQPDDDRGVPIGRPIAGTRAYVLDRRLQPVPVGVPGELYIGGAGVARGYHERPGLTACLFLPEPFGAEPGARMYRTGDRVRYLPDGDLEFLGRVDHQVKIRGFRIEPGEIERVLSAHPGVREAVVVAVADAPGETRLVAYAAPRDACSPEVSELRRYLQSKLPDYMVPAAFVLLATLPLTPSGKVDRAALPRPDGRPDHQPGYVAPRTPAEDALAAIWADVLRLDRVGVRDDFFALGGHSLLAIRLLSRIEQRFGARLAPALLFRAPTIERFVEEVAGAFGAPAVTGGSSPSVVALRRGGHKIPLFLARPAVRSSGALVYAALARQVDPDRPVYAFLNRPILDGTPPYASVEQMASEYVAAMRAVQPRGPYLLAGWSLGGMTAFEMAQQLLAQGERTSRLVLLAPTPPARLGDEVRSVGERRLVQARLHLVSRFPRLARLLPWIRVSREESLMRRFGGLAYYGIDHDAVPVVEHLFPRRFDGAALRAMPPAAMWQHVYDAIRSVDPAEDEGLDAAQVRRGYRNIAADHLLGARYAPERTYPGQAAMFLARGGASSLERWRPFFATPPEVASFAIQGTKTAPRPHNAMMAEENVALMAEALNRVLGPE